MQVTKHFETTDDILKQYQSIIERDYEGYRNHVTRMLNICHYLNPELNNEQSQKLQIAAAFHDIALWTHDRVDYLVPSYQECHKYLENNGLSSWKEEIKVIIDMHHLLGEYTGPYQELTELFRKADLVDFSLGFISFGVNKAFIKELKTTLPNAGFHKTLMRFSVKQLFRNPFKPMPMMRMKNIYRD